MTPLPKLDLTGIHNGSTLDTILGDRPPSASEPSNGGGETPSPAPSTTATAEASPKPRRESPRDTSRTAAGPGDTSPAAFYGGGTMRQLGAAVEPELYDRLTELARDARVPINALFVAAVHGGLPVDGDAALDAVRAERLGWPGRRREGYTPRLPLDLKERLDELTADVVRRVPGIVRADLINAALRAGLPSDPPAALELVREWKANVEAAAFSAATGGSDAH